MSNDDVDGGLVWVCVWLFAGVAAGVVVLIYLKRLLE